jgi:tetratricopeptide (TPR) repeat protein
MMVKDEEERLPVTLKSIPKNVKLAVFFDTGSTDKTMDIIKAWGRDNNVVVHLVAGPFIDFASSRNYGLKYTESLCQEGDYILILDSNDEVVGDIDISIIPPKINAVMVNSYWEYANVQDAMVHIKFIIIRAKRDVHYKGRVHEYLVNGDKPFDTYFFLQNVHLKQDRTKDDPKTYKRFERDIELLKKDIEDKERIERSYFYLGKTYMMMNRVNEAVDAFKKRVAIKEGELEEIHQSYNYLGKIFFLMEKIAESNDNCFTLVGVNERARLRKKGIKALEKAYNTIPRIEPLMDLVDKYMEIKDYTLAYMHVCHACNIMPPQHSNTSYNVKPFKVRFLKKAEVCFYLKKLSDGVSAIKEYKNKYGTDPDLIAIMNKYVEKALSPININTTPLAVHYDPKGVKTILIACGFYYSKWDGNMLKAADGVGGSELVAIKNAEYLARSYPGNVHFCCDCAEESIINGVHYIPLYMYDAFIESNFIDTLYVYRLGNLIRYLNVKNVVVSLEDVSFAGNVCIKLESFRTFVCKSQWQLELNKALIPVDIFKVIGNGIDPERFLPDKSLGQIMAMKSGTRFLYTSCPTRGLRNLLTIFQKAKKVIPDAELRVFCDFTPKRYESRADEIMILKRELEAESGVYIGTRISQDALADEILRATFWVYYCTFPETYCISAQEMQAGGVLCLYRPFAGLITTVGPRGVAIPTDKEHDPAIIDEYVRVIADYHNNPQKYMGMLADAHKWALENSWDARNEEIKQMIISYEKL